MEIQEELSHERTVRSSMWSEYRGGSDGKRGCVCRAVKGPAFQANLFEFCPIGYRALVATAIYRCCCDEVS